MSKPAKDRFSQLLDGNPGNKFDARDVLAKRHERRRRNIPFTPVQCFGLTVAENNYGSHSIGAGAVEPCGGKVFERAN